MLTIKTVSEPAEISGILQVQKENLKDLISPEEAKTEGFLTAVYDIGLLAAMHAESPSIIAKDGNTIAGYALVTVKKIMPQHPLLQGLFNALEKIEYKNLPLKAVDYVVVGQLCVAKNYRGLGLVQKIYGHFRTELQSRYPFCITDVARTNPRSLKAHLKTGFQVIDSVFYGDMDWDIVLWDWNNNGH